MLPMAIVFNTSPAVIAMNYFAPANCIKQCFTLRTAKKAWGYLPFLL